MVSRDTTVPISNQIKVKLRGKMRTNNGASVSYASIGIYQDSSLITGAISDSLGNFSIYLPAGKYTIKVSAIGFKKYKNEYDISKNESIKITLYKLPKSLKEVTVTGQKPVIEHEVDRIIFNVENSIFSKGVDAFELLRETPRVEITANGGIKMIGKDGLRVMINGKILNLPEAAVRQKLKSLQSENIARIEVIPIPPAKYSAEGNSGLINIVLKKNPLLGWQGFVSTEYIQRIKPSFSESGTLNYKSKKVEATVSLNNNHENIKNVLNSTYTFTRKVFKKNKVLRNSYNMTSVNGKFQIEPVDRIKVGATFDYIDRKGKNYDTENSLYRSKGGNRIDSSVKSLALYRTHPKSLSLSGYFDYDIDSGKKMSLTYNYYSKVDKPSKNVTSKITGLHEKTKNFVYYEDNNYSINSAKLDFELPYPFVKIETGGAYTHISNQTGVKYYNVYRNSIPKLVLDTSQTNDFNYYEKTWALYVSAQKEFSDKFSAKTGIRYENTTLKGYSPTLDKIHHNKFGKFFPSIFFLYNPNKQNYFSLAYSKRIERPGFLDLNPFRYYSSLYSYVAGNAYLLPSFTHNIEFNYSFKNNLSVTLSYSGLLQGIDYVTLFSNGINYTIPQNDFNKNRFGTYIRHYLS